MNERGRPQIQYPRYYTYYTRPVKILQTADGRRVGWALNWETGGWEPADELVGAVFGATRQDDIFNVTPDDFVDEVEAERGDRLTGDGPVYALYETINSILDLARAQNRRLDPEEAAVVRGLRRRTYRMFEEDLKRRGDLAADPDLVPP
jgi:hypothetical protein